MTSDTNEPMPAKRPAEHELALIQLVNILLRHRRLMARTAVGVFTVVVLVTLILPRSFTSEGAFLPNAPAGTHAMSVIAAQYGFSLPGSDGGFSPEFYSELLRTRAMLTRLVDTEFEDVRVRPGMFRSVESRSGTLVDLFDIDHDDPRRARELALRRLRDMLSVSTGRFSGTVRFSVTSSTPELSHSIATRIMELVHDFDTRRRQSRAAAERRFSEARLETAQAELRAAEDTLQAFLQRNRMIQSPELQFDRDRLQREVSMRQQVYSALAQSYERARIDEVRNTPVVTVIQEPHSPVLPDRRYLLLKGLLGLLFGAALGAIAGFVREMGSRLEHAREEDVIAEFNRLKTATARDIVRPWRILTPSGRE